MISSRRAASRGSGVSLTRTNSFQLCKAHLHDAIDRARKQAPADALVGQRFPAACRQPVETAAPPPGGLPFAAHPAAAFEAVQQRVERSDVETDHAFGAFGDQFSNFV